MLTQAHLKTLIYYHPESGDLVWLEPTGRRAKAGEQAGSRSNGYIEVAIDGVRYKAHRLAWLYVYGRWPEDQIDHTNMVRTDNRIDNLREATNAENNRNRLAQSNSSSGVRGVYFIGRTGRWQAQIKVCGRKIHLGYFATAEAAYEARIKAVVRLHGEFGRVA